MDKLTVHFDDQPIYDIVFSESFDDLSQVLADFHLSSRRVCIVSESRVAGFYMEALKDVLRPLAREVVDFVFPEGEASKNLNTVQKLYERLILAHFDRKDLLVALGGGVVGDLTGFAAATYLRGIDFIQVPTSLLAQVDSSIGGKTGVDFDAYKNMVGAFHMPKLVYMNLSVLKTLSRRQFVSGMGEIIKHGLIKDLDYYHWMKEHREDILNLDLKALAKLIRRSCEIKRDVVERDPKEQGERALLNFGHTLGHAVEKLENFTMLHGECVSLGMVCAAFISRERGMITGEMYEDILETLKAFGLPVALETGNLEMDASDVRGIVELDASDVRGIVALDAREIVDTTRLDKKMEAGAIKFILLDPAGHAVIDKTVSETELMAAAQCIGGR